MRESWCRRVVEMVVLSMVVVWPKVLEARVNELEERVQIPDLAVEEKLVKFYQIEVEKVREPLRTITERMHGLENELMLCVQHKYLLQKELEGLHEKIAHHQQAGLSATQEQLEASKSNAESGTKKKIERSTKEMEELQSKATTLEAALETATKKEQELTESLDLAATEKKQLEDTYRKSSEQLFGTENLLQVLRNKLKVSQEKLEGIGNELEATEAETVQKLKSAEEQLEEKVTLHETYTREGNSFLEKSRNLEHHLKAYEVQLAQSTGRFVLLKEELYQLLLVKTNTEIENEELKRIISESNDNAAKTTYENEMLVATIIQLKYKINELEISLSTPHGEKGSSKQKHDSHSRAYEVADKEGKELSEANFKLTQKVANYESRLNDLQTSLSAALGEKDETLNQLHISKKAIEDLTEKFTSEGQQLQSQISSLVEENKMLTETHENARKELQTFIATLEVEVKEHTSNETSLKTELENLKAAMEEKAELKMNLKNLEEKLAAAQNTIAKQKETHPQKELERDAALNEVEAKNASLSHLETQTKYLTEKLIDKPKEEQKIGELTEDLNLRKVPQVGFEEDLLAKESQLEELKRKLQEEENAKVLIQDELKSQEAQLILIQEQLAKATNEKDALDAVVVDLRTDLAQTKDRCSDREAKLQLSTENLKAEGEEAKLQAKLKKQSELLELKAKETQSELEKCSAGLSELSSTLTSLEEEKKQSTDKVIQLRSELAQSSAHNTQLELELKSAVEKYTYYETRAKTVHQLSVQLEDMIRTLNFKSENSGQRASELLLETKKYIIQELEVQISTLEKKCKETEEVGYRKVSELESELDALQSKATALEAALETATKKEQELTESLDLATTEKEHLRKSLEQLVETENSLKVTQEKLEGIEKELEATKMREAETIQKLKSAEEQLEEKVTLHETHTRDLESRLHDFRTSLSAAIGEKDETLNQLHISKKAIQDLTSEGQRLQSQISSLVEEKKMLDETHESAKKKLQTLIATLEVEVKENTSSETSLKTVLENLKAEMEENAKLKNILKNLEEEKKQRNQQVQDSTDKVIQLRSELAQSSAHNTQLELELKSAVEKYTYYETRAKTVHQLSVQLEDMIRTLNFKSENSGQRASELLLETKKYIIQELEVQISTLEKKCKETEEVGYRKVSELESELDALQSKATALEAALETATKKEQELTESLDLATTEKEHLRKSLEQLVETENSLKVTQEKLEGIEKELEATKMREAETIQKLKSAEEQLEEKVTLHETHTRDLESRLHDFRTSLSAAIGEKDETLNQLHISKKAIQDLTSEGQRLQSQISSLVEEKKMLDETHESAKKKLQTLIATLEVEVKENTSSETSLKTVLENLKAEMEENAKLKNILKNLEEEKKQRNQQVQDSTDKVIQLRSELAQSSAHNTQLELELKSAVEKYTYYETRAKTVHQLSVQLEDMIRTLNFKSENSGQRASELLLETKKYIIQELEVQISTLEKKCKETEEVGYRKVSELESELDALQSKATALEAALETATKKEQELTESLDLATTEKEHLRKSLEQLVETENSLKVTQEKLEGIEKELEATKMREAETIQKLKSAEEQLEEKVTLHETHTRDLESRLHDFRTSLSAAIGEKDETLNQLHISKKAIQDLTSEGQRLQSQISSLVEEKKMLDETHESAKKKLQTLIATLEVEVKENTSSETSLKTVLENLKAEMEENAKLKNILKNLEEEKKQRNQQVQDSTDKVIQLRSELAQSSAHNTQLELELKSAVEKYTYYETRAKTVHQLSVQLEDMIRTLNFKSENSGQRASELLLETKKYIIQELEVQISTLEKKCKETEEVGYRKVSELESELDALQSKATALEAALETATKKEQELTESLDLATTGKEHLRKSLEQLVETENSLKVTQEKLEGIEKELEATKMREAETIQKLKSAEEQLEEKVTLHETHTRDLESRLNDLQTSLSAALSEKDETLNQLHISKKEIEDLTEKFNSEGQRLQSQIWSPVEEKKMLNEITKKELQKFIATLEVEVKEHTSNESSLKTELENLKAEMEEKAELKNKLKNLEEKLAAAQNTIVEQKEIHSQRELERDAAFKEVNASLSHLETQIKYLKIVIGSSGDGSIWTNFKFILGVSLVSIIVGIVLGKRC